MPQRGFDHRLGGVPQALLQIRCQRAHVHPHPNRNRARLGGGNDLRDLLGVSDVPRIQAKLRDTGLDSRERHLVIEVYVRNDRNGRAMDDRGQAGRVGRILHRHAHDLAAFHREAVDLLERLVGVGRVGGGHRLNGDRMVAADPDALGVRLAGLILQEDRLALASQAQRHYITPFGLRRRAISWKATSNIKAINAANPAT